MAEFPTDLVILTAKAALDANVALKFEFDEALELLSYTDRRKPSRRQVEALVLQVRNHLLRTREVIAEIGLMLCKLNQLSLDVLEERLQPDGTFAPDDRK
jgi:hypothetical protein